MIKYPEFIEWLDSIKLDNFYVPSEESLKNLYSKLEPYSFEELERNFIWMMEEKNEYYGSSKKLLIYAMKARDIQRASRFFCQPEFWNKLKFSFLEPMVQAQISIEPAVLEKALKDLQEKKPEDRSAREWNQEKIGKVLVLMKMHGGAENLARVKAAEESDAWPTVEVLLKDRLREAKIFDPFNNPWTFLEKYGEDQDHLEDARKERVAIFAIFEFDAHICGDGLLVFSEHRYYGKNPFMPHDFVEFLRVIGDEEMIDLMNRYDPVYAPYSDPDVEMTDEQMAEIEPFEDEYYERNTKMRVLAYRYILNHPEIFK